VTAFASQVSVGGRFLIEREIGRGAVGIVYRAMDEVTNQPVALKVIAISGVDAGEEARFRREGRVLAGLVHPGIVRLVAFGQLEDHVSGGMPYVAMEWLEGEDISQRQKRSPLPLVQCLDVAAQVCDALAAAHAAGIVHRDVKPSNVILVGSGAGKDGPLVAKLVDFGVASAEDAKLTRTGAIIGTPAYMAPEQARGDEGVNARADLYALGATLFEMISGRPPHVGPTPIAILARLVTTPPPRLSDIFPEITPGLDDLMAELLATDSSERPHDAGVAADRLRALAGELAAREGTDTTREVRSPQSTPPISAVGPASQLSHSSGGSRLVTTILATHVPKGPPRTRLVAHLRARGAEATELGGDALVAHLGVSRALGDEATRAIDLALRLAKVNATVGIATGRSRVERGVRPIGEVVDRAAALARDASRGQVVLDTTTAELARGRYEFQIREDGSALVGSAHVGKKDALGGAPFVGREAELSQLVASFERALDDRTPVLVTLTGAPGIGKTRLRREAIQRVSSHSSGARVVLARCETFGKSHPLGVAADLVRQLAGVPKGVDLEDARLGSTSAAHAADAELSSDALELLARLLANEPLVLSGAGAAEMADARAARDALWLALTQITVGLARKSAIVVGIEDAQWCDHESLSWLDHVLARAAGAPFWVMLTTRPSFWREDPERFVGRDHVRIEVRPLSKRSVRTIARAILGERVAQGDVIADSIATQAAGSPLFAEELARLAAQGRDAAQAPTIEAAMQVQLDSLDDATRDAASRLSVFGQVGWDQGLEALGVPNAHETLRMLASSEIVVEQAQSRFKGTREFSFKHALMREVAYAALGEDALRDLHARAGQWLAKMAEDDATVARHLELGHAFEEAAIHLEKAARRALAAHALADAVTMAEKSLAFANDKPTQFARAQLLDEAWSRQDARAAERDSAVRSMEEAVYDEASEVRAKGARVRYEDACGGDDETSARIDQVRLAAQAAGLVDEEARSAAALASRHAFAGDLDAAAEVAEQLLSLAQRHSIPGAVVDAWQTLAVVRQARGDVGAALEARRAAAHAASEAGLKMREATLTINVGFALTTVGAKAEARVAIEGGIALAQAIGSPGTVRHGQMNLLCWAATFGSSIQIDRMLVEPRAVADAAAAGSWVPHDRATLGVLYYRGLELLRSTSDGDCHERARSLLRAAAQGYRATKMLDVVPVAMGFLAEAERRCGAPDKAREIAREAAKLLDEGSASLLNEAPVFLALHDACVDLGDLSEAREAILRGIPRLAVRVQGLSGTPYPHEFLTQLQSNAGLLAAAEAYGLMPKELAAVLGERASQVPPEPAPETPRSRT
jgi:serine/threonine protein kinase